MGSTAIATTRSNALSRELDRPCAPSLITLDIAQDRAGVEAGLSDERFEVINVDPDLHVP